MKSNLHAYRTICLFIPVFLLICCSVAAKETRSITNAKQHASEDTVPLKAPADSVNVYVESSFPGGKNAWIRFLSKTFRYPAEAMGKNIQGTVVVKFTVDEKGRLNNLDAASGPKELREEAINVISKSGRWRPATSNGHPVRSEREQLITFKLENAEDERMKIFHAAPKVGDSSIASVVDKEAAYPGGAPGWLRFLNREFHYPEEAVNDKIQGTVLAMFIVDKNGMLSEIETISGPTSGGLRDELIRLIKKSGNWIPATVNNLPVKAYKMIPLTFKL
jgi:TonB family protein